MMKSKPFQVILIMISFFTMIALFSLAMHQSNTIEQFSTRSTHKLKIMDTQRIDIGPFINNGQYLICYNPSINYFSDGELYCLVRMQTEEYSLKSYLSHLVRPLNKEAINAKTKQILTEVKSTNSLLLFPLSDPSNYRIVGAFGKNDVCKEHQRTLQPKGFEDGRLFTYQNQDWVYSHYFGRSKDGSCLSTVKPSIFMLSAPQNVIELTWSGSTQTIDKNWMPIDDNGVLYFIYCIYPKHIILRCDIYTGNCTKVAATETLNIYSLGQPFYSLDTVGGGAPPKLFRDTEGIVNAKYPNKSYYLSMAHVRNSSSFSPITRKNFFYVFEDALPFRVIGVGLPFDCINDKVHIEFGSGMVIQNNKHVFITYGVEDSLCFKSTLLLTNILRSLTYE